MARRLRGNPSFDLSDTYVFPGHKAFLHFLFENLEVTGSLARASGEVSLRVRRLGSQSYAARTSRALEGHCYRLNLEGGQTRYVGRGAYHQRYVPFVIRGLALVDLNWEPRQTGDGVVLRVRLRLIPSSDLIGVVGTVFHPLVRLALKDLLDRVVEVGRDVTRITLNQPNRMLWHLRLMRQSHASRWEQFLKSDPREGDSRE